MGSIAASVAESLTAADIASSVLLGMAFSVALVSLLGAAHVLGAINTERATQHQMVVVGISLPMLSTFSVIIIREAIKYIQVFEIGWPFAIVM